ncbi:hypothetical protein [Glutamicibacter sp.]|uniref:hypothetical protein n=1 Tax=Glutamicibacter sp. TaxID=1931995 RepID=UPI0028BEB610|nr:hypothetical protein [Glutamicibacter sp.]
MNIDVEIRSISDDDAFMATVPQLKAALGEGATAQEAQDLVRASVADITGSDVESVHVASVIHLDDADGD